jgi:hypothetical protein
MAQEHLTAGQSRRIRPRGHLIVAIAAAWSWMARPALAQPEAQTDAPAAADPAWPYAPPADVAVPPQVEEAPIATVNGGFCFAGPHPTDPRFAAGASWDDNPGTHVHEYPPIDLRLFSLQNGCYYFVGDPSDFGFRGQTFAYYGAHPVLPNYGGGWCYMIGGHHHAWRPWSPYFVVAGPWYYWQGAYDRVFWNYWPYYATYYRREYPTYYRGGRFARGGWADRGRGGYAVAPPIGHVGRAVAGPAPGRLHFGAPAPAIAGPSPAPHAGWGQTGAGWGSTTPNQGWGTARPAWGANRPENVERPGPQIARPTPTPAPSHGSVAIPGVNGWGTGRSSFGHDSSEPYRGFATPGNGSVFRHGAQTPSPTPRSGGFHRR